MDTETRAIYMLPTGGSLLSYRHETETEEMGKDILPNAKEKKTGVAISNTRENRL